MTDALVSARNVRKSYGSTPVLQGVDLDVHAGEVVCLLGPSGVGKSTFLRAINHLETIDSGSITVGGELIGYEPYRHGYRELSARQAAAQRLATGMVFQRFNLFSHLTVLQNIVEAPVGVLGVSRAEAESDATALLERVGLSDKRDNYPGQLSGGQQQRVAIARALAMKPKVMLFDEPTSALDPELVGDVLAVMVDLASAGMTMICVTHEVRFARRAADRVVFMHAGRVAEDGPPEAVLDAPTHPMMQKFLKDMHS